MAKILIVDDDPDITESMKVVLESKRHEVISAPSGKRGLAEARKNSFDLIILDVMMETGDSGFTVARELRKDEKYQDIPILMLTAIEEKTGMGFKKEAGDKTWLPVTDYVEKPLKPEDLLARVEKLLKLKA